jgi:death-on-curing protein
VKVPKGQFKKGVRPQSDDEIGATAAWLENNSRKIKKGEKNITFAELYRILRRFGYQLGHKRGNMVEILKQKRGFFGGTSWTCVYKAPCPGDGHTVQVNEIKSIRKALGLTEENGVDSESFYDTQVVIDTFIRQHRNVLRQLAKT